MDFYPDLYSQFMFPGTHTPGNARSVPQHAYADEPCYDQYFPGSFHRQTPRDRHANYEDSHLYHRQPRQFRGYYEPQNVPYLRNPDYSTLVHLDPEEFPIDPACIDLRILPAFAFNPGSGQSARQHRPVGAGQQSQPGSPRRRAQSASRQVPVEDVSAAEALLRSQFPFVLSRYQNPPSRPAASHRSDAESVEDIEVEQPQDLASEQQRLQHLRRQQQEEEHLLRQNRAQEEREHRLAQQLHERELQKEQERRLEQHLREQRLAEERDRRLAYQHMQEQRRQQLLYQRQHEQELAEEELRLYEAAQRQRRLQQQRQEQQRQHQLAEALLQQQQELQQQEALIAAQQRQLLQHHQRRRAQQAPAKQATEELQKVPQQQAQQEQQQQQQQEVLQQQQQQQQKVLQQHQKTQSQQQQPERNERLEGRLSGQQTERGGGLEGRASVQQPGDDAGSLIQKLMSMHSMRAEHPMVLQLAKANTQLNELSQGLRDVTSCVSALQSTRHSQPAKLKQCQGQLGSPEQLQKRLVELGERSMQVVLSMDELHSENDKVRSLRKRIVKKALGFMEDIDNIKSSMLHSILVPVHANDDQSEFDEPVSEAVSDASEDAERTDVKHEPEAGAPAVTTEPFSGAADSISRAAEGDAKQIDIEGESEGDTSAGTAEPVIGAASRTANAAEDNAKHSNTDHEAEGGMPPVTVEPVSGAVSKASEAAGAGGEQTDIKHVLEDGVPAVTKISQNDEQIQQVADALATLKVAEEAAQASAAKQQLGEQEGVNGGNDGEVDGNHGAGIDEGVENSC